MSKPKTKAASKTHRGASISEALTPEALRSVAAVAQAGSMAAAARALGVVPSALTYRVRQLEDALDVLLFDRSSRQARITPAGAELLREGERVLQELGAIAHRVKRVATGWEPQITVAVDGIVSGSVVLELCEAFLALNPPTRVRLLDETLSGTWHALVDGRADLALGVVAEASSAAGLQTEPLGDVPFVFAVAPHHPLAGQALLTDEQMRAHRIVAVADSTSRAATISVGILAGQDVLTVASMQAKLQAQLRGLGCGFLPVCLAQAYIDTGRLVAIPTQRALRKNLVSYAWRPQTTGIGQTEGLALQWWLNALRAPKTRHALLHHTSPSHWGHQRATHI